MSRIVLILLGNDILQNFREGGIFNLLFRNRLSIRKTVLVYLSAIFVYFFLTSILPLLVIGNSQLLLSEIKTLAPYYHFIINGIMVLFFCFGAFIAANAVYSLAIGDNESLLSMPMVLDDLVQYRLSECTIIALKSFIFLFFPLLILVFLSIGWPFYWILLASSLVCILALICYMIGFIIFLSICKMFPNQGSNRIFISLLLASVFLLYILIRLFKSGYWGQQYTTLQALIGQLLSVNSFSVWIENMTVQSLGWIQYTMVVLLTVLLLRLLWKLAHKFLHSIYHRVHVSAEITLKRKRSILFDVNLENLNRVLRFLPLFPRIILIKDILAFIRKPNLIIKSVIFIGGIIFLANLEYSYLANPLLFVAYFSSVFVVSRLFIEAIGRERSNILNLKMLSPSISNYLYARIIISLLVSSIILIPLWVVIISVTDYAFQLGIFYRIVFLILNLVIGSIIMTGYSASFAKFEISSFEKPDIGIYPVAMIAFWGLGLMQSLFFYKLDLVVINDVSDGASHLMIILMGIIILISTPVFWYLGKRNIKNHS